MSKTTEELMARVAELEADAAKRNSGPQSLGRTFKSASGKSDTLFIKLSDARAPGVPTMVELAGQAADAGADAIGLIIRQHPDGYQTVSAFIPTKKED